MHARSPAPFRLAWATDIHLNFASDEVAQGLLDSLAEADAALLTGDLAEAHDVSRWLARLAARTGKPVYFVLGNHDYYFGSIPEVREQIRALTAQDPRLCYLSAAGVIQLTDAVALVGHDGWGDARYGDFLRTRVRLNDHRLIQELTALPRTALQARLNALGDEAAAHLRAVLPAALARCPTVLVATHVPPFVEACWHEGRTSDWDWQADFTCKAVGDALLEAAEAWPQRQIQVLCGHTHGEGEAQIRPNLRVSTGGAVYRQPVVQRVLELPAGSPGAQVG